MYHTITSSSVAASRLAWLRVVLLSAFVVGLGLAGGGCQGGDDCRVFGKCADPGEYISPRLQASDVLKNLQLAYKQRNITEYARLLADDFTFCFDPATRPENVPECWDRAADSTATGRLFAAMDVSDIRIVLTYGSDVPVSEPGREKWRFIRITDTFLEIDKVPATGEVITFRVDGDVQDFYLRKGRSPADTLAASPTSREWFLVAWYDRARQYSAQWPSVSGTATEAVTTWSGIKGAYAP